MKNIEYERVEHFVSDAHDRQEDSQLMAAFAPQPGDISVLSTILGAVCLPLTLCGGFFTVDQNTELVTLNYGKYTGVVQEPGLHWSNCWGRELIPISKAKMSIELAPTKIIDMNGSPLLVSGVVVYYYRDTRRAALDMLNRDVFVRDQASAVLKQIVGGFPYENLHVESDSEGDEADAPLTPCLKDDAKVVNDELVAELQRRVIIAGAQIDSFRLNEISYAPEIAAGMLKKQQAEAVIASRHTLVEGAVKIAGAAISRLRKKNVTMDAEEQSRLISNLLVVCVADEQVHPMLQLGTS